MHLTTDTSLEIERWMTYHGYYVRRLIATTGTYGDRQAYMRNETTMHCPRHVLRILQVVILAIRERLRQASCRISSIPYTVEFEIVQPCDHPT